MSIYRAVLCGLGNIAWLFDRNYPESVTSLSHAGAYGKQARTTLVAGFSPAQKDRDIFSQAFGLPTYDSLEELLAAERPEIVSICSPSQTHYSQVMTCLDYDIPMIWLEKPPAFTSAEVDALAAMAAA
ncbi:MAG: Gfo/Idh/MocA family oxidoreductase, partial [Pseudomonadota bacterium]